MIKWTNVDPDKRVIDIIAPGVEGENHKISAIYAKYLAEYAFPTKACRYQANRAGVIVKMVGKDKTINGLAVGKLVALSVKAGDEPRGEFIKLLRWARTGVTKDPNSKTYSRRGSADSEGDQFTFKVQSLDLEQIKTLLPLRQLGRFAPAKAQILEHIRIANGTPGFALPAVGPLKVDNKERNSFEGSINKLLKERALPWELTWIPVSNFFMLVKTAALQSPAETLVKGEKK